MYDNIGKKVKGLAKVLAGLGIASSVIAGISIWVIGSRIGGNTFLSGLLTIIIGFLVSWISSWALYAIGAAADNSEEMLGELYNLRRESEKRNS